MRVLFGIFDWGIGHATRDIPLIEELLKRGNKVDIISTGRPLEIIKKEFSKKCGYFDIPSISRYPKKREPFLINFILSLPIMAYWNWKYSKMIKEIIRKGKYDKIITDYRFDVFDRKDNSYLINHQLGFKISINQPLFVEIIEKWIERIIWNYKYIIVPDFGEKINLSGKLSHQLRFFDKSKVKYTGILSHVKKRHIKEDIDYFISISGQECDRKRLEETILPRLKELKGKVVVTLGKPDVKNYIKKQHNILSYSYLDQKGQEEMMNRAKFIVCRSGYTTIMNLVELDKKKVLFIPSPNIPEQEYLADYSEEKKIFHHVHQDKVDLIKDIKIARKFKGFNALWKTKESLNKFMEIIEDEE